MQVTEITVTAARTFNHPFEGYSNLKPGVVLKATLAEGDNVDDCVHKLQAQAEGLVETHKQLMIEELQRRDDVQRATEQAAQLKQNIENAQRQLEALRSKHGDLLSLLPPYIEGDKGGEDEGDEGQDRESYSR